MMAQNKTKRYRDDPVPKLCRRLIEALLGAMVFILLIMWIVNMGLYMNGDCDVSDHIQKDDCDFARTLYFFMPPIIITFVFGLFIAIIWVLR